MPAPRPTRARRPRRLRPGRSRLPAPPPRATARRACPRRATVSRPPPTAPARPRALLVVRVTSPLYTYGISTAGGRLVEARLHRYRSIAPADSGATAELLPKDSRLLGLTLVLERDTIPLDGWTFTASADSLAAGGEPLRLTATRGPVGVELTYRFAPDDYRIEVSGRVSGVGPNGGTLLVGMGPTLANTEANIEENHHALAVVTRHTDAERIDLGGLKPGETRTVSGPLDWVAMKSKYFVTGVLAYDSTGGRIGGAAITARPTTEKRPTEADVRLSIPLPPSGEFGYTTYAGPDGVRPAGPAGPRLR